MSALYGPDSVASGAQRVPMHPPGSTEPREDMLPSYAESHKRFFMVYIRSLLQPTELFWSKMDPH